MLLLYYIMIYFKLYLGKIRHYSIIRKSQKICDFIVWLRDLPHYWTTKSNLGHLPLPIPLLPINWTFLGLRLGSMVSSPGIHYPFSTTSIQPIAFYSLDALDSLSHPKISSSFYFACEVLPDPQWPTTCLLNSFITQVDNPIEDRINGPDGTRSLDCVTVSY